jgi:tetraacyldisaccharide 4'-kinase
VSRIDVAAYHRLVRGETGGPLVVATRLALNVPAAAYRLGVSARNAAFDRGWKETHRAGVPVVSIGNLTMGGTGKTPMVEGVARWFRERGLRVAILSRGYGGSGGLNDEGLVLDQNLPDVPHYQAPDRVALARAAVEESESEVLVLDDGFQHRRLARDLDIVLLDALDPFGGGRLFPRGLLREPIGSLRRAGVVVLSRADLVGEAEAAAICRGAEKEAGGPLRWVRARHAPRDLVDAEGRSESLDRLNGARVAAFCGIGNPEGFRKTLDGLGVAVVGFRAFRDHHPYSREDVMDLSAWTQTLGADLALTTQKDSVKLRTPTLGPVPLYALRIGLEILSSAEVLDEALTALLPAGG